MSAVAYETIVVERQGQPGQAVGLITLNRPERRNAYTPRSGAEIQDAFGDLDEDNGIRAIVVTGQGIRSAWERNWAGVRALSTAAGRTNRRRGTAIVRTGAPRPGNCGLRSSVRSTGLRSASGSCSQCSGRPHRGPRRQVGFDFNRRGVMPEANPTWLVPRLIGVWRAIELLLTGRLFSGADAAAMRLASRALDATEILPAALALGEDIALNVAPLSAAVTKRLVNRFLSEPDPKAAQALESRLFWWLGQQAEAREGVASFLERRAPVWRLSKHAELPFDLE